MSTPHTPHKELAWVDANGGSTADWQCSSTYARGAGSMDGWSACLFLNNGSSADLSKHIDLDNGHTRMLSIALAGEHPKTKGTPIRWGSTLKVGEGRYVRAYGYSTGVPEAMESIASYQHESRQIGSMTWWLESDGEWISWLGGMTMRAHLVAAASGDPAYWHFETSGNAPSLEEAALLASMRHA